MYISQEKLDEFQSRLSTWVAKQGLLFQLTHGGGVRGAQSTLFVWAGRMLLRLLLLVLVAAIAFWIYLVKRVDLTWFQEDLKAGIVKNLGASEGKTGSIQRSRGQLQIGKIDLVGGDDSFFTSASMRGIRTRMGLFDGVVGGWNGETVQIDQLTAELKAGEEQDEQGTRIFQRLFRRVSTFQFSQIEINTANLSWGYSGVTRGSVVGSQIRASRKDGGWSLIVTGGLFSQNWMQDLAIERMEIMILPSGIEVREAKMKGDRGGEVSLTARLVGPSSSPKLSGEGVFTGFSLDRYFTEEVANLLSAKFSGTFELGGSPYASSGVTMKAAVKLVSEADMTDDEKKAEREPDAIQVRDFGLFQAFSVADIRSYKNVHYDSGRFTLETGEGVAVISDIWLIDQELTQLKGELVVRKRTDKEAEETLRLQEEIKAGTTAPPVPEDPGTTEFDLRDAARAARAKAMTEHQIEAILEDDVIDLTEQDRFYEAARQRLKEVPILEGRLQIGLMSESLKQTPVLAERYPVDEETGWRWVPLPLSGPLSDAGETLRAEIMLGTNPDQ